MVNEDGTRSSYPIPLLPSQRWLLRSFDLLTLRESYETKQILPLLMAYDFVMFIIAGMLKSSSGNMP